MNRIVMNSMSEMHAEIAERDRQRHVTETGTATTDDELHLLDGRSNRSRTRRGAQDNACDRNRPTPPSHD